MAKQTFTTGQVLTAAQMTSLQQTAMGGGSATAKTASYVLVAADAGTTVAMNAAGATTITVNTGLFAAGDTVFIQNLGAGACTVTAGTATVATAGSLILPQNDAGILYFTATGAAIFYDYVQPGITSPVTTKGDLYTFSTSDTRLAVGANGTTLVADSSEATGLKYLPFSVLQTKSVQSSTQQTSTSSTYADITSHTLTITPNSATNKILIVSTNSLLASGLACDVGIRILRDATNIFTSVQGVFAANVGASVTSIYLDSPATTSATTYKVQFNRATGSGTAYSNVSGTLSNLVVMEIYA